MTFDQIKGLVERLKHSANCLRKSGYPVQSAYVDEAAQTIADLKTIAEMVEAENKVFLRCNRQLELMAEQVQEALHAEEDLTKSLTQSLAEKDARIAELEKGVRKHACDCSRCCVVMQWQQPNSDCPYFQLRALLQPNPPDLGHHGPKDRDRL